MSFWTLDITDPAAIKPYKNYSPQHFSFLRGILQALVVRGLTNTYLWCRYRPIVIRPAGQKLPSGNFLVVSNHISMQDPMAVAYILNHPVAFMAKQELFRYKPAAWFYWAMGTFAVDRDQPDSASLKTALNALRSPGNWALCLFPEGTRSQTGELLPLKKGAGALAIKVGVPVVPVGIKRLPSGRLQVRLGEAMASGNDVEALQEKLTQALQELIA